MSALAITEAMDTVWAEAACERPADLRLASVSSIGAARPAAAGWQLTERGIAVAVIGFISVFVTALVVLIGAFLAVPNEPLGTPAPAVAAAVAQG